MEVLVKWEVSVGRCSMFDAQNCDYVTGCGDLQLIGFEIHLS